MLQRARIVEIPLSSGLAKQKAYIIIISPKSIIFLRLYHKKHAQLALNNNLSLNITLFIGSK
jgi:hypothetical protein